jgi:predicted Zn-dependent protease with MMP-like domain
MDDARFKELVSEALDSLPKEFAEKLSNVSVTVDNFPTPYQVAKARLGPNMLLFGLYEGVPQTKRGVYYSSIPDKITIFKYAIEMVAHTEEQIKERVRQTVIHEIGHHFGLSDAELRKRGL